LKRSRKELDARQPASSLIVHHVQSVREVGERENDCLSNAVGFPDDIPTIEVITPSVPRSVF
jgi:hypothetical protein